MFFCLLEWCMCCRFQRSRLLGCRARNCSWNSYIITRTDSWVSWIIWNAFWCSLMCLTAKSWLCLLLVMTQTWSFYGSSKITIRSPISLSLNLCLSGHILYISSMQAICFLIETLIISFSILNKLTWTICSIWVWEILFKSILKE